MYKKKSLGQHFLRSPHHLKLIADAAQIQPGETVLEIGPGEGVLTSELLARGARVIAVEKDRRLVPLLRERFAGQTLEVVEADALEFDTAKLKTKNYKLVGNIPYYITGALFKKFLSNSRQPSRLVFLIQKEVAQRIARSKKESILSLSVKAYGTPRLVAKVPRGAFAPPPKVDSALLLVEDISRKNFKNKKHEQRFFELVRAGFAHKRKFLAKNLEPVLGKEYSRALEAAGVPKNARAEDLTLPQWLKLGLS